MFEKFKSVKIERPEKFGGDVTYGSYAELESDFSAGKLHPVDLKNSAARCVDGLLEPVRKHFEKNAKARKLLEQVNSF